MASARRWNWIPLTLGLLVHVACAAAPPSTQGFGPGAEELVLRQEATQEAAWMAFARGSFLRERGSPEGALAFYGHAVQLAPEESGFRLALARQNLEMGRLAAAEDVLEKAAAKGLAVPAEFLLMARLRVVSGRPAAALESLGAALQADSSLAAAWVLRGRLLSDREDYSGSLESLQRADVLEPNLAPTQFLLGGVYEKLGRDSEAIQAYATALRLSPEMHTARVALAEAYERSGQIDQAIQVQEEGLELDPEDAESLEALLQLLMRTKHDAEALELLQSRYERGTLDPRQESMLGWLYLQLDRPEKAEEVLGALAEKTPSPGVENLLGELALRDEDFAVAEKRFRAAIALDPDDCASHVGLATTLLERERRTQAGKGAPLAVPDSLRTALAAASVHTGSDELRCNVLLGYAFASIRDFAAALPHLEAARVLEPDNAEILFNLAMTHQELGHFDRALDLGRYVLDREPDNAAALNFVGYIQAERGVELEESEGLIRKALRAEPENGYFVDSLGWVYYQMGRFDEAAQQLEHAVELTGAEDAIILEHLGDAYHKAGRLQEAHRTYLRSRQLDPSNEGVREKIEELEKSLGKP